MAVNNARHGNWQHVANNVYHSLRNRSQMVLGYDNSIIVSK